MKSVGEKRMALDRSCGPKAREEDPAAGAEAEETSSKFTLMATRFVVKSASDAKTSVNVVMTHGSR